MSHRKNTTGVYTIEVDKTDKGGAEGKKMATVTRIHEKAKGFITSIMASLDLTGVDPEGVHDELQLYVDIDTNCGKVFDDYNMCRARLERHERLPGEDSSKHYNADAAVEIVALDFATKAVLVCLNNAHARITRHRCG